MPFSLDKLTDVPRYVYKSSYMTKCDDKSGYDHVLLSENSQTYFGFSLWGLVVCMYDTAVWMEDIAIHLSFSWASCNGLFEGSGYIVFTLY